MISMNKFLITAFLMAATTMAFAENNTATQFKNTRGSVLNLTMHAEGKDSGTLTGTFTSAVGNCAAALGKAVPVTGFYNGHAIALAMNFAPCKQVIAMKGHFDKKNQEINTLWLGVNTAKESATPQWDSNIIGHDHFVKVTG